MRRESQPIRFSANGQTTNTRLPVVPRKVSCTLNSLRTREIDDLFFLERAPMDAPDGPCRNKEHQLAIQVDGRRKRVDSRSIGKLSNVAVGERGGDCAFILCHDRGQECDYDIRANLLA